jgi:hypothetical protein
MKSISSPNLHSHPKLVLLQKYFVDDSQQVLVAFSLIKEAFKTHPNRPLFTQPAPVLTLD